MTSSRFSSIGGRRKLAWTRTEVASSLLDQPSVTSVGKKPPQRLFVKWVDPAKSWHVLETDVRREDCRDSGDQARSGMHAIVGSQLMDFQAQGLTEDVIRHRKDGGEQRPDVGRQPGEFAK